MTSTPSCSPVSAGMATSESTRGLPAVYSAMHAPDRGAAAHGQPAEGSCELPLDNSPIRSHYNQEHGKQILDEAKWKITHDVTNMQSSVMGRKDPASSSPRMCLTVNDRKKADRLTPKDSSWLPCKDEISSHGLWDTSTHIPVPPPPRGSVSNADLEVMAVAALTSLCTSPLVLNDPTGASGSTSVVPEAASRWWKAGLSPSYSSSTSDNCSWDTSDQSGPSTPSPPLPADAGRHGAPYSQDLTYEPEPVHFLFDDPCPRKRKSSVKVMFQCLWKNCAKVLSTSSGIQKHVRTVHLGLNGDSEHSEGEEDFYYSEIEVNMDSLSEGLSSLLPASPSTAPPLLTFPPSQTPARAAPIAITVQPALKFFSSPLSQSAPSVLCHIHTDHAYQATPPSQDSRAEFSAKGVSSSWQSHPKPLKGSLGTFVHICTGEMTQPVPQVTVTRTHPMSAPAAKASAGPRKLRGDARKCRKVYGMDKKDMWCTACRWKKACQRFTD
ncbi:zinc finger protein 704-like isoform X2 [Paramormyrops kingsleyae]